MHRITGKQSKTSRSLLKWNIYDLANRVKSILPKRLDSFEHGMVHLMEWENDEVVRAFKKAGILFKADLEVVLQKEEAEPDALNVTMDQEGSRIVLDTDQTVLSDSSAEKTQIPDKGHSEHTPKDGQRDDE